MPAFTSRFFRRVLSSSLRTAYYWLTWTILVLAWSGGCKSPGPTSDQQSPKPPPDAAGTPATKSLEAPRQHAATDPFALKVSLRGRVVDRAEHGLAGITVRVGRPSASEQSRPSPDSYDKWDAETTREGYWQIDLPASNRPLTISPDLGKKWIGRPRGPHRPANADNEIGVLTPTTPVVTGLDFVLWKRATISGTVRGPDDQPLAKAVIFVLESSFSFETDPKGSFSFSEFLPGEPVTLIVKHKLGATRICEPVTVAEGQTRTLDVRLTQGGTVRGRVTPLAGRVDYSDTWKPRLEFMPAGRTESQLSLRITRTIEPHPNVCGIVNDDPPHPALDGTFVVEHLPAGRVDLRLGARGDFTPEDEKAAQLPLASNYLRETPPEFYQRIPPGDQKVYPVVKYSVPYLGVIRDIEVRESEVTDLGEIHYEQPGRLTGRVLRADGTTAANATVYVSLTLMEKIGFFDTDSRQFWIDIVQTHTDADGKYAFEFLCRGPRRLWTGRFDAPDSAKREFDMDGRAELVVDLRADGP
ncbi:MAG TPA: carboxypeptidase regulatory-like domain-containing protein [Phycisphaerae bacterium]|nr:carboxypeptidase regulatory-like domain-containing protein [Phycisphaerae bacterium]